MRNETVRALWQFNSSFASIAYAILHDAGQLRKTRLAKQIYLIPVDHKQTKYIILRAGLVSICPTLLDRQTFVSQPWAP